MAAAVVARRTLSTARALRSDGGSASATAAAAAAGASAAGDLRNVAGIPMLAPRLWQHVFGGGGQRARSLGNVLQRDAAMRSLLPFQLWQRDAPPADPAVAAAVARLQLPPLQGADIAAHFEAIARRQLQPYAALLAQLQALAARAPPLPRAWRREAGWTLYPADGGPPRAVAVPGDAALVLDVEVLVRRSPHAILAAAVGPSGWYSWVGPQLWTPEAAPVLVPLTPPGVDPKQRRKDHRIVVGHNVAFDRARIADDYSIEPSNLAWFDTMSMHMAVSGMSSRQRATFQAKAKRERLEAVLQDLGELEEGEAGSELDGNAHTADWASHTSLQNLAGCYKMWCNKELDKASRDIFVEGDFADVQENFQELMTYCANDTLATLEVFAKAYPVLMKDHVGHPASVAGMIEMSRPYLPVDEAFDEYRRRAEQLFLASREGISTTLGNLAEKALELMEGDAWRADPWLKYWNWTVAPIRMTKKGVPYKNQRLPGKPEWYKKLVATGGALVIRPRMAAAPALFRMSWHDENLDQSFPLFYHPEWKWGYLVPKDSQHNPPFGACKMEWVDPSGSGDHERLDYYKLPHKDGEKGHCGTPFAKDFMPLIEKGIIRSQFPEIAEVLHQSVSTTYWLSARERILRQFVVDEKDLPRRTFLFDDAADDLSRKGLGAILPTVISSGTVSRRAVEETWLTASNPKKNRLGSELKALVKAPPGAKLVGADVDSQELWIAAVLGDAASTGVHGGTAFGWMTLQGTKADKTDMHSLTADILGISRDEAKVFNYGRIYGAGRSFASLLLRKFNPSLSPEEATRRTTELYTRTKGSRAYRRGPLSSAKGNAPWKGGTESAMFNRLEAVANEPEPRTPILGFKITTALQPKNFGANDDKFITSRVNWVVQSSAVDYLHLMLVSLRDLIERYDIKARLAITIHDEVRYIVAEEDVNRFALALHLTNLYVRAFFSLRLGMPDLPQSVAFFSAVDVDHVLRKEVVLDCITPSQSAPIPPGRNMTFVDAVNATSGRLDSSLSAEEAASENPTRTSMELNASN